MTNLQSEQSRTIMKVYGIWTGKFEFGIQYLKVHTDPSWEGLRIKYNSGPIYEDDETLEEFTFFKEEKDYIVRLKQLEAILPRKAILLLKKRKNIPREIKENVRGL